jgi:nicotinate phosphoribosyltransferase
MQFPQPSVLLTDLYQLTMLQAYHRHRMLDVAVFEFFVRQFPASRNFLIAAGLEQVLDYLESLRFEPDELDWLAQTGRFEAEFLRFLLQLRFTGDVHAMPEGTVFFPNEPILRVTAPLPEAQLVESRIINLLQFQTLIASKAARCVLVAAGKRLVDFGMRRAHGAEAGLLAARATFLAGFTSTATVAAGVLWNIPLSGTMAHSFVQAHRDEAAAFADFAIANPNDVVLLIDTYDTEMAARKLVDLAPGWKQQGIRVRGVRIDSGDLAEHARRVRRILDEGGLADVTIYASGNLDECAVATLMDADAPIDGFGIGTRVDVSSDAPYLDCAYKLQEYAGQPRRKKSEAKATWPGRKQVFRESDADGRILRDHVALESCKAAGQPLLVPVMHSGRRVETGESLAVIRQRSARQLAALPARLRGLDTTEPRYEVMISASLRDLAAQMDRQPAVGFVIRHFTGQ